MSNAEILSMPVRAMHMFTTSTAEQFLELGKAAGVTKVEPALRGPGGARLSAARADEHDRLCGP
jgi:hypothetical protein